MKKVIIAPKEGDIKIKKRFAVLPTYTDDGFVWMESYWIMKRFQMVRQYGYDDCWDALDWATVKKSIFKIL